ncbi:MAG TPA: tetratricopeptide repeat protein, partial [Pyrinomonadaceae bacterium]|nr:tetratricopeptide repeat protein [Pyrinomonadaceae bacterium]
LGNLDTAISDFNEVIHMPLESRAPFDRAHLYRGLAYLKKGEKDKAVPDFNTAIQAAADPKVQEAARTALSQLNVKPGEPDKPADTRSRQDAISDLFSPQGGTRVKAYGEIMENYSNDPALVPELLSYARARTGNQDGIYNTLVVLSHINRERLRPYVAQITDFARAVESIGPRIKERVDKLLSRMPT